MSEKIDQGGECCETPSDAELLQEFRALLSEVIGQRDQDVLILSGSIDEDLEVALQEEFDRRHSVAHTDCDKGGCGYCRSTYGWTVRPHLRPD